MNCQIRTYDPIKDQAALLNIIQAEGEEWKDYLKPNYLVALEQSITYVAYVDRQLCGYSRSMADHGLFIWVIDLLVAPNYRGHGIGQKLMHCLTIDYPNQDIYVMSDVDDYYQKLGYSKEGSIFKVK